MNVMDDTLADESGIPFLSSADDIPVHSTPIKGTKIPLPSTKDVMKQLLNRPGRYEEYTDGESVQSIRHSDIHLQAKGQISTKDQGQNSDRNFVRKTNDFKQEERNSVRNMPDLSDIDNLRQKSRNLADLKSIQPERSRSPLLNKFSTASELGDIFKRPKDVPPRYRYSVEERKRNISRSPVNNDKTLEQNDRPSMQTKYRSDRLPTEDVNSNAYSSSKNVAKYTSMDEKRRSEVTGASGSQSNLMNFRTQYSAEETDIDKVDVVQSSRGMRSEPVDKYSGDRKDLGSDRSRFSLSSPRQSRHSTTPLSRTSSSLKQNTSLSELENTTLQKQRQEIQLLMSELKDRDRELSDMMTSHQQQLVAWQQDRDRLVTLERKCTQHEEDLRSKASQLRNALSNIKTMKTTEGENKKDLEKFRSTIEKLSQENTQYKEEISQLQGLNESLQANVNNLSNKVGKLEAREEELTTSLRLKEKDISSATSHMRELSERLQQLDLKCKECQDRERDALREKQDWKQKYENTKDEFDALAGEMDLRRKEAVRLAEENKSARQQLALIQKEASMMERCKDELIDSMRVKQERTDTQLRNLRELYDRQVREVASLQLQLDNSKELIYRQQSSLDDQQLSSSYQGRLSQASEYSLERSSASQRQASRYRSSPSQSGKYREQDMTGSHQHSQSSGYQSQIYENQTGNHPVPNTLENNYINLTGSKQFHRQFQGNFSDRTSQSMKSDNQYISRQNESNRLKETGKGDEKFINTGVESDNSDKRNPSREMASHSSLSKDNNFSAKVLTCTPPKVANKLLYSSPQRHDGYVIQETTIEFFNEDLEKNSNTVTSCCEMSETALEAMRKAEKMLSQHSDTHKQQEFYDSHKEQGKYVTHKDQNHDSDTQKEKERSFDDMHTGKRKYAIHKEQTKPFSAAYKGNENQNNPTDIHKEQGKLSSDIRKEQGKLSSDIRKEQGQLSSDIHKDEGKLSSDIHKEEGKLSSDIHKEQAKHFTDTLEDVDILGRNKTDSCLKKGQGNFYSYTHKDSGKTENAYKQRELNSDASSGAKNRDEDRRREVRVNLDDQFAEADHEDQYDKEFEKKYTFENKLCSFLEDLDDIDDSIWDEKPIKSTNVSTTESSPASKLRKLLIESQEMIQSLEKSTESPRQVLTKDIVEQKDKGSTAATGEKVQDKLN